MIEVSIINEATAPFGCSMDDLVAALQIQVDRDVTPAWGVKCHVSFGGQVPMFDPIWRMILLNDADQAEALGYHELTPDGLPQAKVFVQTTLNDKSHPSTIASHELLEMLLDPKIDQTIERTLMQRIYAVEICDAVEGEEYLINGIPMSDFQLPGWFCMSTPPGAIVRGAAAFRYDFMGRCSRPWQILPGGYMSIQEDGGWSQIFSATRGANAFKSEGKWRPQARETGMRRRSLR